MVGYSMAIRYLQNAWQHLNAHARPFERVAFQHAFDSMRNKLEDFFSRRSQAEQSNKIIWNH